MSMCCKKLSYETKIAPYWIWRGRCVLLPCHHLGSQASPLVSFVKVFWSTNILLTERFAILYHYLSNLETTLSENPRTSSVSQVLKLTIFLATIFTQSFRLHGMVWKTSELMSAWFYALSCCPYIFMHCICIVHTLEESSTGICDSSLRHCEPHHSVGPLFGCSQTLLHWPVKVRHGICNH